MPHTRHGIYFNPRTREIVAADGKEDGFPLEGWVKVSADPRLGLLAARKILVQKKLVKDGASVYWSGMRVPGGAGREGWAAGLSFPRGGQAEGGTESSALRPRFGARLRSALRALATRLGARTNRA